MWVCKDYVTLVLIPLFQGVFAISRGIGIWISVFSIVIFVLVPYQGIGIRNIRKRGRAAALGGRRGTGALS